MQASLNSGIALSGIAFGFFGKIPARGDFVRAGLPREFVAPWDEWLQAILPASRAILGEAWLPAWMEAPVWRFCLGPGHCGPQAAIGVLLPSVDRAGRHFPLTLARVGPSLASLAGTGGAWLDAAETAGIFAIEQDTGPDELLSLLQAAEILVDGDETRRDDADAGCRWCTRGAPRVPAGAFATATLPGGSVFARMLDAGAGDAGRS
jgi:type VI secretion system protein ImpM